MISCFFIVAPNVLHHHFISSLLSNALSLNPDYEKLKSMRKNIVAGNWKMNKTFEEGLKLASEIVNMVQDENRKDVNIVLIPPFIHLNSVKKLIADVEMVYLGAQNCSENEEGAYTGDISSAMLKSVGADYVLVGHSERRQYHQENDDLLGKKVQIALKNGLTPIFCCGEPLEIRESNQHFGYVKNQISNSVFGLTENDFSKLVIAYEPIWAIGTGKTATTEQAQEMHAEIRQHIAEKYGKNVADNTSILYGGSCNPTNAAELFACPDVDGGLIGGASLKSRSFLDIVKSF